ncbi:unnamed protein product [Rhodiola kirilowii]
MSTFFLSMAIDNHHETHLNSEELDKSGFGRDIACDTCLSQIIVASKEYLSSWGVHLLIKQSE